MLLGCSKIPSKRPADFGFILKYGFEMPKNVINTFEGSLTKDLIAAGDTTISFHFTEQQLDAIYKIMIDISLLEYPDDYVPTERFLLMPRPRTEFTVKIGSQNKQVRWSGILNKDKDDGKRIGRLIDFIISTVDSTTAYKNLPEPKGGYF